MPSLEGSPTCDTRTALPPGPEWRNWQTQETQNLPPVTRCVGSIPSSGTTFFMTPLTPGTLRDVAHIDSLVADSFDRPLVIFKHSRSCGTSHEAQDELQAHLAQAPRDATYVMITVQEQRPLSDAIAQRFSLRHETPQVLVVRDGKLVWSATHFRVTADALGKAIDQAAAAQAAL